MKKLSLVSQITILCLLSASLRAQDITIRRDTGLGPGNERPILVSLNGFAGEADQVIHFDLYVQGFAVTNSEVAQYLISGSANGNLQGRVTDRVNKNVLVAKAYSGASLRRQAHAFVDDFVQALGRKPIGNTKLAFKGQN